MNVVLRKALGSSFVMWVAAALMGALYLFSVRNFKPILRDDRVKFGIDLVGGTYITLEVQTEKALESEIADHLNSAHKKMRGQNIAQPESRTISAGSAELLFANDSEARAYAAFIQSNDQYFNVSQSGPRVTIKIKDQIAQFLSAAAVRGNIDVLRTRLDSFGVGEITIAPQGDRMIIIELPNVDDPQKAKAMIGKAALLEIKLVEKTGSSPDDILDQYDGELPGDMMIVPGKPGEDGGAYYLVPAFTDLTGRDLKDARVVFDEQHGNQIAVGFDFSPEGGEKFYDLTKRNFGRQIALILDGTVISAPRVSTAIRSSGIITQPGGFAPDNAKELAMLLKSGAFTAPVEFAEERQIGPSLGQESVNQGLKACGVGMLLLFLFSVIVYKTAGIFAFAALVVNLLLILLAMVWIGATLTLPGIAGMVLTVGMAIDASILIYEKIREELKNGIPMSRAVQSGFSDAIEVILDSNITTFIVGAVLYKFGTGPIQGFALTMMVGIISTLVTGLFFLRSSFTFFLEIVGVRSISI